MSMFCFFVEIFACSVDNGLKHNVLMVQLFAISADMLLRQRITNSMLLGGMTFYTVDKMIASNLKFHKCAFQ